MAKHRTNHQEKTKNFLCQNQAVEIGRAKKGEKYLVGKEKGSTFAIPNDEVSRVREERGSRREGIRSLKVNEPR